MTLIGKKVLQIIAERAFIDVNDLRLSYTLASLGMDSLALVETIFAIEDSFDISVPFNANTPSASGLDAASVADMIAVVESLILQKAA